MTPTFRQELWTRQSDSRSPHIKTPALARLPEHVKGLIRLLFGDNELGGYDPRMSTAQLNTILCNNIPSFRQTKCQGIPPLVYVRVSIILQHPEY